MSTDPPTSGRHFSFHNALITGGSFSQTHISNSIELSPNQPAGIHELSKKIAHNSTHDAFEMDGSQRSMSIGSNKEGIYGEPIDEILAWIRHPAPEFYVMWLDGAVEDEKTVMFQFIANLCDGEADLLAGSFFFGRGKRRCDTAEHFIPTIAYQIATRLQPMREQINQAMLHDPTIPSKNIATQFKCLIDSPFLNISNSSRPNHSLTVIVDAIDNCSSQKGQKSILGAIRRAIDATHIPLRFLISSRPESQILEYFDKSSSYCRRISLDQNRTTFQTSEGQKTPRSQSSAVDTPVERLSEFETHRRVAPDRTQSMPEFTMQSQVPSPIPIIRKAQDEAVQVVLPSTPTASSWSRELDDIFQIKLALPLPFLHDLGSGLTLTSFTSAETNNTLSSSYSGYPPSFDPGPQVRPSLESLGAIIQDPEVDAQPDPSPILPSTKDIVIALIGPTGKGKSTFINTAVGQKICKVGHDLESCTQEIQAVSYISPEGERTVLVDTPGFNDTNIADEDILGRIASWLTTTYKHDVKLSGLLYFHDISDNRMAGSPLKLLRTFKALCGQDAYKNVILVTTMWDQVTPTEGERREKELRDQYWKSMLDRGSRCVRFMNNYKSAWDILSPIAFDARQAVLLQREMVDEGLPLPETSAGRSYFGWLTDIEKRLERSIRKLRRRLRSARGETREPLNDSIKREESELRTMGGILRTYRIRLSS